MFLKSRMAESTVCVCRFWRISFPTAPSQGITVEWCLEWRVSFMGLGLGLLSCDATTDSSQGTAQGACLSGPRPSARGTPGEDGKYWSFREPRPPPPEPHPALSVSSYSSSHLRPCSRLCSIACNRFPNAL